MSQQQQTTSRAVVRVFFLNGLFKTASIDGSVTSAELCRMIGKKVAIEKSAPIDTTLYTLYECRDDDRRIPWKKSPLGTFNRKIDPSEHPFSIVATWISRGVVSQSRFVLETSSDTYFSSATSQQQQNALLTPISTESQSQTSSNLTNHRIRDPSPIPTTSVACSAPSPASPLSTNSNSSNPSPPITNNNPNNSSTQEESEADVRACLDFVNEQLIKRSILVHDISELTNGVIIIKLLEQLTELKIKPYNEQPKNKDEELSNWSIALKFLQLQGCTLTNSIPEDFYYGSTTTMLSLLAVIAKHFQDTPPIAKALRKSMLLRRFSKRYKNSPLQQQQQQVQPSNLSQVTNVSSLQSTSTATTTITKESLEHKEKQLADKEAFLTSWERSLQQREEDLIRREKLFLQQQNQIPGSSSSSSSTTTTAIPERPINPPPHPTAYNGRNGPLSPSVPQGNFLFAMIQRRISRCERGIQRPTSMATQAGIQPKPELVEPPPGLIRVQIVSDPHDSLQAQSVSFRYLPEQTVRELIKLVCAKKNLKEDEYVMKFMNMDVTCSAELTIGELGVIALRLCKKQAGDIVASDLGDLCDQFEPAVVNIDDQSNVDDDGLRRSTFNIEHLQEQELL